MNADPSNTPTEPSDDVLDGFDWSTFQPIRSPGAPPVGADTADANDGPEDGDMLAALMGEDRPATATAGRAAGRPTQGTVASAIGRVPIWPSHRHAAEQNPRLLVTRITPIGLNEELGYLPPHAGREDVIARWGAGEYLVQPIDVYGQALEPQPIVLRLAADSQFVTSAAAAGGRNASGHGPMPTAAPGSVEPILDYFAAREQAEAARISEARRELAEREARLTAELARVQQAGAVLGDRTLDRSAELLKGVIADQARQYERAAERDASFWSRATEYERAAADRHIKLGESALTTFLHTMQSEAAERRAREEREERQRREERLEREHREEKLALEREKLRLREEERSREHMLMIMKLTAERQAAANPVHALTSVAALAAPLLGAAKDWGLIDILKEKLTGDNDAAAGGWAPVVQEAVRQIGETIRVGLETAAEEPDDEDEDEEEYEEEEQVAVAPQIAPTPQRPALPPPVPVPGQAPPPQVAQAPQPVPAAEQQQAIAALRDATGPVGGPVALAALGIGKRTTDGPALGQDDPGPAAQEPTASGASSNTATAPAMEPKALKTARKQMRALVDKLKAEPEERWQAITQAAALVGKDTLVPYLKAMGIRPAAREAGAPDDLIERYITKLDALEEPFRSIVGSIPRG